MKASIASDFSDPLLVNLHLNPKEAISPIKMDDRIRRKSTTVTQTSTRRRTRPPLFNCAISD
uniref:Uncharacterized protein n=1 Tax=Solanum lycopersicum TaxID=4081 RepID=A0A3Q7F2M8_SOLLC